MSFEDRRNALFASLESAEKSIGSDSVLHQEEIVDYRQTRRSTESDDSSDRSDRRETQSPKRSLRKFRGRESIFKRPAAPIAKCLPMSRLPDFQKNPHRWTKYSLEHIDISDRSNTAAAFSFLREIETRKQNAEEERDSPAEGSVQFRGKVKFNRSIKLKSQLEGEDEAQPEEEDRPVIKGAKVLMPEYVVGQKLKKTKTSWEKRVPQKEGRTKEMKLGHLIGDDEEDDEME